MKREVLRMERVTYLEQGVLQLKKFSMTMWEGEIMGLVPLNYVGLSALLKLLQKNQPLHYGYVYYREKLVNHWCRQNRKWNRISIVQDGSGLAEDLTVADNVFVLRPGFKKWLIKKKTLRSQMQPFLDDLGVDISPDAYIRELTQFERILVELLKAIMAGDRLIVVYNVSNFVSDSELFMLQEIMRKYQKRGIAFLYIAPHFEEVGKVCDRTCVFSNGKIVKYVRDTDKMADGSFLRDVEGFEKKVRAQMYKGRSREKERLVFEAEGLAGHSIRSLSFSVSEGECLVLQDMDNNIIHELVELLSGERLPQKGRIKICGKEERMRCNRRVAIIQELPLQTMLFPNMSYLDNLCFTLDHRLPGVWLDEKKKRGVFAEYEEALGKGADKLRVEELTERQKYALVYTRVLLSDPEVVFCVQPFKGAEVSQRIYIWEMLELMLEKGIAVVILAMNLADSLALADRLIQIRDGRSFQEYQTDEFGELPDNIPWQFLYRDGKKRK